MVKVNRIDRNFPRLLGFSHFLVDFTCTALLATFSASLPHLQILAMAILYNGLAFAFQLPIGAIGDILGASRILVSLGCILVALGCLFSTPVAVCILIGLGNACFHIGGGRETLKRGRGSAAMVGRFVAPGAIGIFLGPKAPQLLWLIHAVLPLALGLLAILLFFTRQKHTEDLSLKTPPYSRFRRAGILACMFLTVLLRSYMGTVLRYSFLSDIGLGITFTLCIFGGKYFGGILADRFGALNFSIFAQITGTILFILSAWLPLLVLPGIFLFNTTMAITATELYRTLPHYPGTMFGLTTFALYLGVLPRLLEWPNPLFTWWGLGLLSLLSAVFLLGGLKLIRGGQDRGQTSLVPGTVTDCDSASGT